MRKIIFLSFVLVFGVFAESAFAQASPLIPFGGLITTAPIPGAICPTALEPTSPFIVVPSGATIVGPFAEVPGPQAFGQTVPGAWILGLYLPTPIPDCTVGIPPAGTVMPVFKATIFGTSVPIDLPA
ncbi:MAG: hypothetical protein R3B39_00400 [Candidatus Paceibacterota bacterium]